MTTDTKSHPDSDSWVFTPCEGGCCLFETISSHKLDFRKETTSEDIFLSEWLDVRSNSFAYPDPRGLPYCLHEKAYENLMESISDIVVSVWEAYRQDDDLPEGDVWDRDIEEWEVDMYMEIVFGDTHTFLIDEYMHCLEWEEGEDKNKSIREDRYNQRRYDWENTIAKTIANLITERGE